jgi:NAD(P)H-dependent flavin oxidoreductase YrpB (nitropropane dioxygenase family)
MLGIQYPILLAGMGGVSYAEVCAAVSEAGGFGTLGMAGRSTKEIRDEMRKVRSLTSKPFGVDLLAALADNDSHPALDAAGELLRTGPTGTNTMDVIAVLVSPR